MKDTNTNKAGGANVHVNVGEKQGFYVGSASNMARLMIMICILFSLVFGATCYYFGNKIGVVESKIQMLESKVLR